jgi:hypothetical protein
MKYVIILIFTVVISGCGINSIKKTTYLEPGMSTSEVREIMGEPTSSEFSNGYMVWKYSLQEPWVGYIPYYLAFDENSRLVAWQANMDEYYANQALWLQSIPEQHNVTIDVK